MRIVCMGDSLTYGYGVRRGKIWTKILSDNTPEAEWINRGVSGDTTEDMKKRFSADVLDMDPDCVFLMGGSNDIFFYRNIRNTEKHLADMVAECKEQKVPVVLMTPFPTNEDTMEETWKNVASGPVVKKMLVELRFWIKEFCGDNKINLVDTWKCLPENVHEIRKFYLDGIHLSTYGHEIFSDYILKYYKKFTKYLRNNLT